MRAIVVTELGAPLRIAERADPEPGPGRIVVGVRAFGVNRADLLQRMGLYPAPPGWPDDVPGLEYAGEVLAGGPGVETPRVGERVMGLVGGGGYADRVEAAAAEALPVPETLGWEEAAAIPEAFLTAHDALDRLRLERGDWVLVHAVGSGVGTAAVQLARHRGLHVIGTSRTASKLERARDLGVEVTVDVTRDDFVEVARRTAGARLRGVVDLVGGATLASSIDALAPCGRLVLVGLVGGLEATVPLVQMVAKRITVQGTSMRGRSVAERADVARGFRDGALGGFGTGALRPVLDSVVAFDDVESAHARMRANESFGKIVVRV